MNDASIEEEPEAVLVYVAAYAPGGRIREPSKSTKKPGTCGTVVIAPVRPEPRTICNAGTPGLAEAIVAVEYATA
mgnify:CR=1 FL=1